MGSGTQLCLQGLDVKVHLLNSGTHGFQPLHGETKVTFRCSEVGEDFATNSHHGVVGVSDVSICVTSSRGGGCMTLRYGGGQ